MRDMSNHLRIVQWFLDLPKLQEIVGWPVGAERLVASGQDIHRLSKQEPGDAQAIADAWNRLGGALGLEGMGSLLLERGEWQRLVYESAGSRRPWREHDDYVVVWDQPAGCVVATVTEHGDTVEAVTFDVRKEA